MAQGEESASDIKGIWAESQITAWIDKGFIKGYEDGSFKPNNTITRAEFFALINRSFGFTEQAAVSFRDVTSSSWAYAEVAKAVKAGYITGYADGTIGVSNPISRQEVAVIINRLLGLTSTSNAAAAFTDSSSIASWAKASVDAAVAKGILKGYADDNSFKPTKLITRAEAVVTLDRAVTAQAVKATTFSKAGTYGPATGTETIIGDVVINVTGVTLQNMIITGNILFAEGIGEGDATLKNVTIKGLTRVEGGGANSIHLNNSVVLDLIVDKKNGTVRIVIEGSTAVGEVTISSPATLQETDITGTGFSKVTLSDLLPSNSKVTLIGAFDSLTIKSSKIQIDIPEGSLNEVIAAATATGSTIKLDTDAGIINLVLDAVITILGKGTIETATLSSVAKAGTTFETPPNKVVDKAGEPTPPAPTVPSTGGRDTSAPILTHVTIGQIATGDDVHATSNKNGYLYLVPSTTAKKITDLNQAITAFLGKKLSVTAAVDSTIPTAGLPLGNYVIYAVDSSNNISAASAEIVINRKQLTISNTVLTLDKIKDGNISAAVTAGNLIGVAPGDDITVSAVAAYEDATLGINKTITVVYTIAGADAAKYIAPVDYIVNNGEISKDLITKSKVYDGTTAAAAIAGPKNGVIDGDDVTITATAAYNDKNVGTNKEISVDFILTGEDAGNYEIFGYKVVGVITALQLTIAPPVLTATKVFDGTTAAVVTPGSLIGVIAGDDVTVHAVATYNNSAVGTNKTITIVYTLSGEDAGNYVAPASYIINTGEIKAQ